MTRSARFPHKSYERGNVFAMLFAAVALTGVLAAVGMQTLTGPVSTITRVTQRNVADNNLLMNAKIIVNAAVTAVAGGDSDADGIIEPAEFVSAAIGETPPTNGGFLPTDLGLALTDPWGTKYGYCVWDHGTTNASTNRLTGDNTGTASTQVVLALIAAGPDKTFQTTCSAYSGGPVQVTKASGSDDLIFKYSYAEAAASSNGLWSINVSDQAIAELKDSAGSAVNVTIDRDTGIGDFLGLTTSVISAKTDQTIALDGGLLLDADGGGATTCTAAEKGSLRLNTDRDDLELCDGAGGWVEVRTPPGGIAGHVQFNDGADGFAGDSNLFWDNSAKRLGVGGSPSTHTLDVTGTFGASGNATIGGTLGVTGAAILSSTLDVTDSATLSSTLSVSGNATFNIDTLYVDADNDRVGVGTASPAHLLDVTGAADMGALGSLATSDAVLHVDDGTSNLYVDGRAVISDGALIVGTTGAEGLQLVTDETQRVLIAADGTVSITGNTGISGATSLWSTLSVAGIADFDSGTLYVDVPDSRVGVGTSDPLTKLDVAGGVKIGGDSICNISKAGMVAWNSGVLQLCGADGNWTSLAAIEKLDDIGDVDVPSPNANEVLAWDGTSWVAKNINLLGPAQVNVAGNDGSVQFRDGSDLGADPDYFHWDKDNHRLGVGTASPAFQIDILSEMTNGRGLSVQQYSDNIVSSVVQLRKARGTASSPAIVYDGDFIGGLSFQPYAGGTANSGFPRTAWIVSKVDSAPSGAGTGSVPTALIFSTGSTDDGGVLNERIRIASSGLVGIGTTTPQSLLHVAGGIQLGDDTATCPGASNEKLGTLRFNGGNLQVCKSSGWSGVGSSGSASCPSGFTKITAQGQVLGCMQTNENAAAVWPTAANNCFTNYGGRLPTAAEWYVAAANYTLTNETGNWEHLSDAVGETSPYDNHAVAGSTGTSDFSWSYDTTAQAYRCFIPVSGGGDTLAGLSCASGEIPKWNGSAWACAADGGGSGSGSYKGFVATGTLTSGGTSVATLTGYTEQRDDGNTFNPSTGVFTAPEDGYYSFSIRANFTDGNANYATLYLYAGGTQICTSFEIANDNNYYRSCAGTTYLTSGQTAYVQTGMSGGATGASVHFAGVRLGSGGGSGTGIVPAFSVNRSGTDQTVTAGTEEKIDFTSKAFDVTGAFDLAADRFVPTTPGKYIITAGAYCPSATNYCQVFIRKNGVSASTNYARGDGSNASVQTTAILDMNGTTDYVEAYVKSAPGTTISGSTVYTYLTGSLLGGGADTLAGLSCASGEIAKWNGSAWECAVDGGGSGGATTIFSNASGALRYAVFNGVSGATVYKSGGVSDVIRTGAGEYVVKWTTPFANDNYVILGSCNPQNYSGARFSISGNRISGHQYESVHPSQAGITCRIATSSSNTDSDLVVVVAFDLGSPYVEAGASFNGSGGASVYAQKNVSSITRTAAGKYTVTWSTPFPDNKYVVLGSCNGWGTSGGAFTVEGNNIVGNPNEGLKTNSVNIGCRNPNFTDSDLIHVVAVRLGEGFAKKGAVFNGSGGVSNTAYSGVSSVSRVSAGLYDVNWSSPFASEDYVILASSNALNTSGVIFGPRSKAYGTTASKVQIEGRNSLNNNGDTDYGAVIGFDPTTDDIGEPSVSATDTLANLACNAGEIAKWNGSAWACATDGGGGSGAEISASIYRSTSQSIPNASWTPVSWTSELFDNGDMADLGSQSSRITIPAGHGGRYIVSAQVGYAANATNGRWIQLYKNGSGVANTYCNTPASASLGGNQAVSCSWVVDVAAADYLEIHTYQNSGGALNLQSGSFTASKLSAGGSDTLAGLSCASGEIPKWNGSAWACAADGGGSAGASSAFFAHRNGTGQTINDSTVTAIAWTAETFDTNGDFDTGTGKFKPTIAGKYLLSAGAEINNLTADKYHVVYIYKNGSAIARSAAVHGSATNPAGLTATAIVDANGSTDEFDVRVYQSSGSSMTLNGVASGSYFSGALLAGGSDTLAGLSCSSGEIPKWNGTAWVCAADGGGSGGSNPVAFHAHKNGTNQTVTANAVQALTWSTEAFDTNNNFDTGNGRFTPTVAGKYLATVNVVCNDASSYCQAILRKNGTIIASNYGRTTTTNAAGIVTTIVDMNGSTDYLDAAVWNASGTTIGGGASQTYFTASLLGGGGGGSGAEVSFTATLAANTPINNATWTDIGGYTENSDVGGNNFNPTTGKFTAPSTGTYVFSGTAQIGATPGGGVIIQIDGTNAGTPQVCYNLVGDDTGNGFSASCTGAIYLTAGQTVEMIAYQNSGAANNLSTRTQFSGFKVGGSSDTLAGLSCASGEIPKWNGSAWGCATDGGGSGSGGVNVAPTISFSGGGTLTVTLANGIPLYNGNARTAWGSYGTLPSYLVGTKGTDTVNGTPDGSAVTLTITGGPAVCYMLRNDGGWAPVPMTGWVLKASAPADFTSFNPGIDAIYHRVLVPGTYALDSYSAMYACSTEPVGGGGSATPGGTDTQVQFNDNGTMAGAAQLFWDKANNRLGVNVASPTQAVDITGTVTSDRMIFKSVAADPPMGGSTYWSSDGTHVWRDTGNVGIGTASPVYKLDVGGNMRATGSALFNSTLTVQNPSGLTSFYLRPGSDESYVDQRMYTSDGSTADYWRFLAYGKSYTSTAYQRKLRIMSYNAGTGSDILTLAADGNVGIGVANPAYKLDMDGSLRITGHYYANGNLYLGQNNTATSVYGSTGAANYLQLIASDSADDGARMILYGRTHGSGGRVYLQSSSNSASDIVMQLIRRTSAGTTYAVKYTYGDGRTVFYGTNGSGSCYIDGDGPATTCTSDRRLKKDIETIPGALESLVKVRGVSFNWKEEFKNDPGRKKYGVIAQELQAAFPDLVTQGDDGYLQASMDGLIPVLVEATKELKAENDELRRVNASILKRLEALEAHAMH